MLVGCQPLRVDARVAPGEATLACEQERIGEVFQRRAQLLDREQQFLGSHSPIAFDHHAPRCRAVNAILLAAGYGTRIRSLFPDTPKALIEVGGRALIDHLLANLARSGVVESALVVTNDRYHAALQRHLSAATPPAPPASRSGSAPWATCTSPCAG